jgi:hypothetical protein
VFGLQDYVSYLQRLIQRNMHKVLITGATGMVGKGVLLECLEDDSIEEIVLINRNPIGIEHSKIREILLKDFFQLESIQNQLPKLDACFHCMGISSAGVSELDFHKVTFDITKKLADVMFLNNPEMVMTYVSGAGTDATENGSIMWARVKGKTENYLLNKGFGAAYMFQPGAIVPEKGIKSRTPLYNAIYVITRPFFPIMKKMKNITTTTRLGQAMIATLKRDIDVNRISNQKINEIAQQRI